MNQILVDSNVLLDVLTEDSNWFAWSSSRLAECAAHGRLCLNATIYAEVSVGFERIETLDDALPHRDFTRLDMPWDAAFIAVKAFLQYRRSEGVKRSPLPDFFIGAHAAISSLSLLTRDARRYRTYFPTVNVIAPSDS